MQLTLDHDPSPAIEGAGILGRLARRKTWCLLGFTLTAAVVGAVFSATPRTYRASAALMVASNEAVLRSGSSSAEAQRLGDPADIESQMLMLRSPRLARAILEDSKVVGALVEDCEAARTSTWATSLMARATTPPKCELLATDRQTALQRLEGAFSIGPTGRSRVIEVSFVSPLPETAVIVSNALVDAYLRDDKDRKLDTHDNAINWLIAEIDRSGQELRRAEQGIETYRAQNGIVRGQQASIASERLSSLSPQLAAAQASYAQAVARLGQFSAGGSDASEVLNSRTIADLKQQAGVLAARHADLRARFGDGYPAVQSAADQKREVDRRIEQEGRRVGVSLQRDVQAGAARIAELKQQFDQLMGAVGNAGGAEAGIAIMVRDVEARREIYVEQLKKVNVLQTERRLLTGDARLVHYAELPERPWFPKRLPFIAVGLVLSSAVGAAMGLVRDRGDRTLRTTTNLPQVSGIPVAGYIPWVRQRRGSRWPVLHLHNPSPLQEAVRALFSRCVLVPGEAPKTLMIGSSDVGEGKTFLTLAISLFAVTTGRRVLVIEADLRRPTFRKALSLPPSRGLSEFLQDVGPIHDHSALTDVITHHHGLHVVTAGAPSVASTELLSSARFDSLLRVAAAHYDLVILDSPPTLLLMDAQVLARRVDGIVYCASFGRSQLDRVQDGIRGLTNAGGNVIGIAVGGARGGDLPQYNLPGMPNRTYLPAPV